MPVETTPVDINTLIEGQDQAQNNVAVENPIEETTQDSMDYSWDGNFDSLKDKPWWLSVAEPVRNSLTAGFELAKTQFLSESSQNLASAEAKLMEAEAAKLQTEAIFKLLNDMPSDDVNAATEWQKKLDALSAEKDSAAAELQKKLDELDGKHSLTSKELADLQKLKAELEQKSVDFEQQLELAVTKLAESELAYQTMVNDITYANFCNVRPDLAQNEEAGKKFLGYLSNPDVDGDLNRAFKLLEADYPPQKKAAPPPPAVSLMSQDAPVNLESALNTGPKSAIDDYMAKMKKKLEDAELADRAAW